MLAFSLLFKASFCPLEACSALEPHMHMISTENCTADPTRNIGTKTQLIFVQVNPRKILRQLIKKHRPIKSSI